MIKAIETIYDNYHFRSRLEARWAIFFNTLRVKYEYEKEGFDIDGLWYLPDFYLPDYSCWVEIKPDSFVFGSDEKINAFAMATKDTFIVICGIPKLDLVRKFIYIEEDCYDLLEVERYIVHLLSYKGEYSDIEDGVFGLARKSIMPELWLLNDDLGARSLINLENSTDDEDSYPTKYGLDNAYNTAMQARF